MKTTTLALLIVAIMTTTNILAMPVIGYNSAKSARANTAGFSVSTEIDEVTGQPVARAGVDLAGLGDKDTKFMGASGKSFLGDVAIYAVGAVAIKYTYDTLDRYVINRDKYKDKEAPKTMPIDKGSIFLGNGTTVGGSVNTLGAPVKTGEGVVIRGDVNTGPLVPEGGE